MKNTIIYGHSDYRDDPEGKRFSQLFHYAQDIDFVRNNPYIYFSVPEDDLVWQVFAVFFTHIDFNYIQTHPSEEEFQYILDEARARSEYIIDVPVTTEDRILTLSTCSGEYVPGDHTNCRLVVMAKGKVVAGGAMMGPAVENLSYPTTKTTSGLIMLSEATAQPPQVNPCIRCGRCVEYCPMGLEPVEVNQAYAARDVQELGKLHADYCFNCGSCSFVCPAKRPVTQMMSLAKAFYLGEIKKGGNK